MSANEPKVQLAVEVDWDRRFGGLARLYGAEGSRRIRESHVVVVGIGGVGSWAAEALARSGVGRLTFIDMDHIAESNVNRQVHATNSTLGQSKVTAMRDRVLQINPGCSVFALDDFVEPQNWEQLVEVAVGYNGPIDAVIDACDQLKAKLTMAIWARSKKLGLISSGAAGGKRLAHKVEIDDLCSVTHDPLMAQLRHRLRKLPSAPKPGKKFGVTCVFSREAVMRPGAGSGSDGSLNCHGYGSVVSVTSTFGQCAAGWVLDRLAPL